MENLPRGELKLYASFGALNTAEPKEKVAEATARMNTPEFLEDTFFNENNPHVLSIKTLSSGGKVTVMQPSGPYSEDAVMVIARGPHSYIDGEVPTQNTYDFPFDTQVEYVRTIMDGLQALRGICETEGSKDDYSIFATENCMDRISDSEYRLSRSIALPHSQIIRVHHDTITPTNQTIDHLEHEKRLLKNIKRNEEFTHALVPHLKKRGGSSVASIAPREKIPFGYDISFNPDVTAGEVARVLLEHHGAAGLLSNKWKSGLREANQAKTKPMPSYRAYYHYTDEGSFVVSISPEIVSHAGVLEAAGIMLSRGAEHPRLFDDHKVSETRREVVRAINGAELTINVPTDVSSPDTITV